MNKTQKIFAVFFFASIALWLAFVGLIAEFVILAFANASIPGLLYSLVGGIFVFAVLSTFAASSIYERRKPVREYYTRPSEASGSKQWICEYCKTVNNDENAKCENCNAPKKTS